MEEIDYFWYKLSAIPEAEQCGWVKDKFGVSWQIQGKKDFVEELEQMKNHIVKELTRSSIITHGREGAVNGLIKMEDGRKYAFRDLYEFSGAKGSCIKSMISYVIEV